METNRFTWIDFYTKFANTLLQYKQERDVLVQKLTSIFNSIGMNIPKLSIGDWKDIDPFTVYALFNRGITEQNRIAFIKEIIKRFNVDAVCPVDFTGIPVVQNLNCAFYSYDETTEDNISNLWEMFEKAINYADNKSNETQVSFLSCYNKIKDNKGLKFKLSIGLFWIRPYFYMGLDDRNKQLIINLEIFKDAAQFLYRKSGVPTAEEYIYLRDKLLDSFGKEIKYNNFLELSSDAYYVFEKKEKANTEETIPVKSSKIEQMKNIPLNQILYGPPGTGKTYNTVVECIHILDNELYDQYLNATDQIGFYKDYLLPKYNQFREQGIIEFITFHQSYSYEEFVEGIKPQISEWSSTDGDDVKYIGKDGVFKVICRNASKPTVLQNKWNINSDVSIWKVSLGGTYDNPIRKDCFESNRIRIGWDAYGEHYEDKATEGKRPLDAFYQKMKKGDIVLSCYTNRIIDGIGIVEGDPVFDTSLSEYKRTRKVNWILKNIREDIFSINDDTTMTLPAVYKLKIPLNKIIEILHKYNAQAPETKENDQKFVLVIDEINRGNISKIFGELITLIEEDKRSNLSVMLPYSAQLFTVPKNLYIIGTMNTSDRSIATIDIALRRRFTFISKMPDVDLVPDKFSMKEAFEHLNKKIRIILDEDHQIGHSYFMNIDTISDLKETWANKIIPLLNEYFYGDWTKLKMLIPGFISENPIDDKELEDEIGENCYYRFKNPFSLNNDDFIKATLGLNIENTAA